MDATRTGPDGGVLGHAPAVDVAVTDAIAALCAELRGIDPGLAPAADLLADAASGGKRLRGALVRWSYTAHAGAGAGGSGAGGSGAGGSGAGADAVTGAAVAVELVHLSALVHDDVIDRTDLRRGLPSVHVRAGALHPAQDGPGAREHGRNVAILLGDVLLAAAPGPLATCRVDADALAAAHAALVRLQVEVMAGQYLDVDAAAARSADPARALTIATLKSGRYSVSRPLELGALLAGADATTASALLQVGDPLGLAFQLRDDLLGVFGDPEVTGKPAGSDLVEGKRTLFVAETLARLDAAERTAFDAALGVEGLDDAAVAHLAATVERSGARAAVEERVEAAAAQARDAIGRLPLAAEHRADLAELAGWMTTRAH